MQTTKTSWQRLRRELVCHRQLYLLLVLPVAYLIIFRYIPMFGSQIAFRQYRIRDGILGSTWIGLANFEKFFTSSQFTRLIGNTLRLSLYSLTAGFPLPILLALILNTLTNVRMKKLVQNLTYLPYFISTVVVVGILLQVFNTHNGVYGVAYKLITGQTAPDLLAKPEGFVHLYVWSGVWKDIGWGSIIYLAALSGVDLALHEAALIDGATRFQRLRYIDIPAIVPTIVITLILRCGSIMSIGFESAYLMQNNLNLRMSEVISTYVYKVGLTASGNYSYATAIDLFNSAINLTLLVVMNFLSRKLSDNSLW